MMISTGLKEAVLALTFCAQIWISHTFLASILGLTSYEKMASQFLSSLKFGSCKGHFTPYSRNSKIHLVSGMELNPQVDILTFIFLGAQTVMIGLFSGNFCQLSITLKIRRCEVISTYTFCVCHHPKNRECICPSPQNIGSCKVQVLLHYASHCLGGTEMGRWEIEDVDST